MKVAIIYNRDINGVINTFGIQNKEFYNENTVNAVAQSLEKAGHNVAVLDGNKQIIERLENFMPRVTAGEQPGMVFNMAYGIQGESRYTHIPSMLEMLGVPYVGSSPSGHALALDKVLTKIIWKNHGLPTPDFWVFNSEDEDFSGVKFPVIVKPKMESVSFGLKVVYNETDLKEAVGFISGEFRQQALVEQFIRGREFCVGLLGNGTPESFPVLEIDLDGDPDGIQTVDDKKLTPKKKICPAHISDNLAEEMKKLSIEAFRALNLRDFSRIDIRLDEDNNIYLLEINSMASLGKTGSYPTAAAVAGYDYAALVNKMLDVATVRYFAVPALDIREEGNKPGKISQEARMRTFIKSRESRIEKLLKKMVDTDTYVRNVYGVNKCAELIGEELGQLGFNHQIYPQAEVGNMIYYANFFGDTPDYLILLPIDSRIKLADHENYSESEQYLEGSGIWENKGGVAVTLAALQALRFIRILKKVKIGILLVTDSSINNRYSKNLIASKATNAREVLGMCGSAKNGSLVLSRSGAAIYHFETKLIKCDKPENVARTGAAFNRTLAAIADLTDDDEDNLIAPYETEFKSNIFKLYAYGSAGISVRFNNEENLDTIEKKIKKIITKQKRSKIFQTQFEGGLRRPSMEENEASSELYKRIVKTAKSVDVRISKEHRHSSAEICYVKGDKPKIDGFGPTGEFLSSKNERILRHSLLDRALLLALVLRK